MQDANNSLIVSKLKKLSEYEFFDPLTGNLEVKVSDTYTIQAASILKINDKKRLFTTTINSDFDHSWFCNNI